MSKESLSDQDNDGLFKQLKVGLNEEQCKKLLDQTCKQQVADKVDNVEKNTSLVQSDGGSEDFPLHDGNEIMDLFIHAISIPEPQLSQDKLREVGCRPSKVEEFLAHLESKHFLHMEADEWETKEVEAELNIL